MSIKQLAVLGGDREFESPIPVGQLYFPSWKRYKEATSLIFERQYYTNQGPLVSELENRLKDFLQVEHVVCVTNATIGLMIAADALELTGKVIVPSFTFLASPLSISWCGLDPVFCDVDPDCYHPKLEQIEAVMSHEVCAFLGVNLWGGASDVNLINSWAASNNIITYWDSAQAFGCEVDGRKIGGFGALEVFSLHATKIVSAGEGGCITTNNEELADKLRNIRSSYGAGKPTLVKKTANGRMSEFQAAIALMSLEDYHSNRLHNICIRDVYSENLKNIPGLDLLPILGVSDSNYQSVVVKIDPRSFGVTRDSLVSVLHAENVFARRYFTPGSHKLPQYAQGSIAHLPATDFLNQCLVTLPIGSRVSIEDAKTICEIMQKVHDCRDLIPR